MRQRKTLWFDLTNTPHVHFLKPIYDRYFGSCRTMISFRPYAETAALVRQKYSTAAIEVGKHAGFSRIKKAYRMLDRVRQLNARIPHFDIALSCGGFEASLLSRLKGRIAVSFDDNDVSPNWLYSRFVDYAFFPKSIAEDVLIKQGFAMDRTYQYDGFKEDIYLADYDPDTNFPKSLPFRDYVIVRPENRMASYVTRNFKSIVPELLNALSQTGCNILYLPRNGEDNRYTAGIKGIYVPPAPVNGLDAVYFSSAVFSGAGSLTREAACLGKIAVSFYAGERLLAVDREMIERRQLFHSRDCDEIVEYWKHAAPRRWDRKRCAKTKSELFARLDEIIYHN